MAVGVAVVVWCSYLAYTGMVQDALRELLMDAVQEGNARRVAVLLHQGASPNSRAKPPTIEGLGDWVTHLFMPGAYRGQGRTALMEAVARDKPDVAQLLLERGADPNAVVPGYQDATALLCAARAGSVQCARQLLDRGCPVDGRNQQGSTPLMRAAENDRAEVAAFLLDRGADVNATDSLGSTPLVYAVMEGSLSAKPTCIGLLIRHGAHINTRLKGTGTPLLMAVITGRTAAVKELLRYGASPSLADVNGITPLQMAQVKGVRTIEHMLRQADTQ